MAITAPFSGDQSEGLLDFYVIASAIVFVSCITGISLYFAYRVMLLILSLQIENNWHSKKDTGAMNFLQVPI